MNIPASWNLWRRWGEGKIPSGKDAVTRYMKINLHVSMRLLERWACGGRAGGGTVVVVDIGCDRG